MADPNTFSLASRSLKLTSQEDIEPHLKPLIKSQHYTHLNLSGNTLGPPASSYLATLLPSLQNLESANLADIFTSRLLSEIPPALSSLLSALLQCPKLETVDLSDNAFGLNTVAPLVDFLSQHTRLRHLILQNNGLGPAAGAQVADALTALARKKAGARKARREQLEDRDKDKDKEKDKDVGTEVPLLETVICGRNRLESGSMGAWARCYQAHHGVKVVKMVQNGIRPEGIVTLLRDGLGACEGLEVVDLQDNTFTSVGATALCGMLGRWGDLRELGVGDCLLSARGAVALADELAKGENRKVEVLRLQYNEITAKGVNALAKAAEHLPKLRRVELNGNKFAEDDEGVEELRVLFDGRKGRAEEKGEREWGLDELSDLEEDSDEEDEAGDEDEDEEEGKRERLLKEADQKEAENVAEKNDDDVDALAEKLGGTHV